LPKENEKGTKIWGHKWEKQDGKKRFPTSWERTKGKIGWGKKVPEVQPGSTAGKTERQRGVYIEPATGRKEL